ncbi:hypothetical protein T484DRAFT_3646802 [Baffinella frigidus]|nr:hypothetical protein T484DRAFT_3646802 [Cryptophyta sp. CCMP2293]
MHAMRNHTDAECDALIAGMEESIRAIQARSEPVALARTPDTKMKNRPDPAACWSDFERDSLSERHKSLKRAQSDNVPLPSSLRRTSSERRRSLSGISWNQELEAVCIIPARGQESQEFDSCILAHSPPPLRVSSPSPFDATAKVFAAPPQEYDSFMALVQTPPPLRPSSPSPFDVTATAAGAAAASRAGVRLAMANSFKHSLESAEHSYAFENDACSWLSAPSAPSAKSDKPKRHTVMKPKWARGNEA